MPKLDNLGMYIVHCETIGTLIPTYLGMYATAATSGFLSGCCREKSVARLRIPIAMPKRRSAYIMMYVSCVKHSPVEVSQKCVRRPCVFQSGFRTSRPRCSGRQLRKMQTTTQEVGTQRRVFRHRKVPCALPPRFFAP